MYQKCWAIQCKMCRIKPSWIWVNHIIKDCKFQNTENLKKLNSAPGIYPQCTVRYAAKRWVKSIWKHSTKQNFFLSGTCWSINL
jgi:hypothetical protein